MSVTNIISSEIKIGIEKPFEILHMTDTHLTLADDRNDDRKIELAKVRSNIFIPSPEEVLAECEAYAKIENLPIVHTGDLIDFVSEANLDRAKTFIDNNKVLFIAGNHEFSLYVGEAPEDEAYRNKSLSHVQSYFKDDIRFNSNVINGVNFVGIDNSYYRFDKAQLEALKNEVEKGLPIILFMHNSLFENSLFEYSMKKNNNYSAYLIGTPEELLKLGHPSRVSQQLADDITNETIEYIKSQPLIKAMLTGHLHWDFESAVTNNLPQYVTGLTTIRRIKIV